MSGEARPQAALTDFGEMLRPMLESILTSIEDEYQACDPSSDAYRVQVVRRLLTQEIGQSDMAVLEYPIYLAWHAAVIAVGPRATDLLRRIESKLGLALLVVPCGDLTWAWLGSRRGMPDAEKIRRVAAANGSSTLWLAIGSPHPDLDGWRQTHREAQRALLLALRQAQRVTQYAESPLVTAALEDDTLASWLKAFIRPLLERSDGVVDLLPALRAYIDAGLNLRAAGAELGYDRHTIARRVAAAEQALGRAVRDCVSELDTALRLYQIGAAVPAPNSSSSREPDTRAANNPPRPAHADFE